MELPPLVAGSWPRDLEIQLFDACAEHRPVGMYPYAGSTCLQDHLHRSCTILLPQLAVDFLFLAPYLLTSHHLLVILSWQVWTDTSGWCRFSDICDNGIPT